MNKEISDHTQNPHQTPVEGRTATISDDLCTGVGRVSSIVITPEKDANHPWYHVVLKMEEDLNKSEEAFVECPACGEVEYIYDRSCYRCGYPDRDVGDD